MQIKTNHTPRKKDLTAQATPTNLPTVEEGLVGILQGGVEGGFFALPWDKGLWYLLDVASFVPLPDLPIL